MRRFAPGVYPPTRPRVARSSALYRPPLRACLPAAVLLAISASPALAKPAFETGPYLGKVATKEKSQVEFTATRTRVKRLDIDSQHVTCSDGVKGALNLPGNPAKRTLKLKRGRFEMAVKATGADSEYAGTRLTGRLKGRKATGTIRIVYRKPSTARRGRHEVRHRQAQVERAARRDRRGAARLAQTAGGRAPVRGIDAARPEHDRRAAERGLAARLARELDQALRRALGRDG